MTPVEADTEEAEELLKDGILKIKTKLRAPRRSSGLEHPSLVWEVRGSNLGAGEEKIFVEKSLADSENGWMGARA